jgi:hypothetical protein
MLNGYTTRNDVTIHSIDSDYIYDMFGGKAASDYMNNVFMRIPNCTYDGNAVFMSTQLSFGEITHFVLGDATYDFAIPMGAAEYGKAGYVWLYERGDHFGKAFDVMTAFYKMVRLWYKW